ncbi:MAG: hypothetical protein ACQESH_02075 [Campylobacterota bacterium]
MHKLLVISIASPLLVGVYKDDILIESFSIAGKVSKEFPLILQELLARYAFGAFVYVNSPGSFMAIKVLYVTLKSVSLLKSIPLYAVDGFAFNQNRPIKAIGKLYFIKEDGTIATKKYDKAVLQEYTLPQNLKDLEQSSENIPKYEIPAV